MTERRHAIFTAARDFQRARKRAALRDLIGRLTGRSVDLLAFEDVRRRLRAMVSPRRQLRDIPLDAIVGSVGRATDFTRDFLPRNESDAARWARVKAAVTSPQGVPPIEVYQIGAAYFVLNEALRAGDSSLAVGCSSSLSSVRTGVTIPPIGYWFIDRRCSHDPLTPADD
jgi:hypothetical protein